MKVYNALIRTHHITSRKKIQRIKKAASDLGVAYVLIHYGRPPGIMYAEAPDETAVRSWVAAVQALRYKDFRCVQKPSAYSIPKDAPGLTSAFREIGSVAGFYEEMQRRGLRTWWMKGMGYEDGSESESSGSRP